MAFRELLLFVIIATASGFAVHSSIKSSSQSSHLALQRKSVLFSSALPIGPIIAATLRASDLVYSFAQLRIKVRKDPESYIDAPDIFDKEDDILTEDEIADFIRKNKAMIADDEDTNHLLVFLDGIEGDTRIRTFDAKDADDELVYGIGVNRTSKRVVISFRGTNTNKDILIDLDGRRHLVEENGIKYEVHNGFREYLKEKVDQETEDGPLVSKFKVITDQLEEIMEKDCKGFDIFITGHSLGGALSTYYGFKLAESGKFPLVNVISFASPYVGTESYKEAFRALERGNKLRHIRVSNDNDCIPANPCIGGFVHAGVNVQLKKKGPTMINYEGIENPPLPLAFILLIPAALSILINVLSVFIGFLSFLPTFPLLPSAIVAYSTVQLLLKNHGLAEYNKRFQNGKTDFYDQTIEELYTKRLDVI